MHTDAAIAAGRLLRDLPNRHTGKPLHGIPLVFVTADHRTRERIRSSVAVPTFATEKSRGEIWTLTTRSR